MDRLQVVVAADAVVRAAVVPVAADRVVVVLVDLEVPWVAAAPQATSTRSPSALRR